MKQEIFYWGSFLLHFFPQTSAFSAFLTEQDAPSQCIIVVKEFGNLEIIKT